MYAVNDYKCKMFLRRWTPHNVAKKVSDSKHPLPPLPYRKTRRRHRHNLHISNHQSNIKTPPPLCSPYLPHCLPKSKPRPRVRIRQSAHLHPPPHDLEGVRDGLRDAASEGADGEVQKGLRFGFGVLWRWGWEELRAEVAPGEEGGPGVGDHTHERDGEAAVE